MAKPALKSLIAATAGATVVGLVGQVQPAKAALLTYDFTVTINQGAYAGSYKGFFSFDDSKLVPCTTSTTGQLCATPKRSNLKLSFNFLGVNYNETSDRDYFDYDFELPAVYYYPDNPKQNLDPFLLSLIVIPPTSNVSFAVLGYAFFMNFNEYPNVNNPAQRVGSVSYSLRRPEPQPTPTNPPGPPPGGGGSAAVPEPSEIAGSVFALGFVGLFLKLRRKK